jgi:hypothetical protein
MRDSIFSNSVCLEYIEAARLIGVYFASKKPEPIALTKRYQKALASYRFLLDKNNLKMPIKIKDL